MKFYKAIEGTEAYEKYGKKLIEEMEITEDEYRQGFNESFADVESVSADEMLDCIDTAKEGGSPELYEALCDELGLDYDYYTEFGDIYYAAVAELLRHKTETQTICFDADTIKEAAKRGIEIHAGEEAQMITAADGLVFYNANHADMAYYAKCDECGKYYYAPRAMHKCDQDSCVCNACDRYEVDYQGGESRYGIEPVDYMLVKIDDIELYAEAPAQDDENANYDELKTAILEQAAEHDIPAEWLKFWDEM